MGSRAQDLYDGEVTTELSVEELPPVPERVKAPSEPALPMHCRVPQRPEKDSLASAPSRLSCLSHNAAPPFRGPSKEPRPQILIGQIMTEREVTQMVISSEADPVNGMRKYFEDFLVEKQLVTKLDFSERRFLVSFSQEAVAYGARRDFNARKLSVLITLYLAAHIYFKHYYFTNAIDLWNYFSDILIRHTISNSPDGEEVFEPGESYDVLSHFHTIYMSNLPLIHILTFGVYRLKFEWPFNPK